MKRYKRLFAILLAVLTVLSLAGCGKNKPDQLQQSGAQAENTPAPEASTPEPETNTPEPDDAASDETTDVPALRVPDIAVPDVDPDLGLEAGPFVEINNVEEVLSRPRGIQTGSSITIVNYDVPSYLPWNSTAENWMHANIYEGLVYCYMGNADDVRPLIAESYTHSDDYLTWVFTIRPGIKFTDGTVCDAAAVSSAWDHYYEAVPAAFTNLNISSWEATGQMEFTVTLCAPCGYIESSFAKLYVLSPTALAEFGIEDNRSAVGTAPYYVSSYEPGAEFVFKANENYYLYERYPIIETITGKMVYVRPAAFLNGDIDILSFKSLDYYSQSVELDELFDKNVFDGTIISGYSDSNPIWLNAKYNPEFQIFEVRKAINRLIDLDELNDVVYGGKGLVQTSIWSVGSSGEVPWPEGFYYDAEEGLALLAQAGIAPEALVIQTYVMDSYKDLYYNISSQLAKVGITFTPEILPGHISFTPWMSGDCQFYMTSAAYSDSAPYRPWMFVLLPEQLIRMVYADLYDAELYAAMRDTYNAMMLSPTWDEMLTNVKTLTDMVQRDYSAIPGVQSPYYTLVRKDIKGIVMVTEERVLLWYYLYF